MPGSLLPELIGDLRTELEQRFPTVSWNLADHIDPLVTAPAADTQLAWLTSSLATVGGALGAGLETDDAVREGAYSYRTSTAKA